MKSTNPARTKFLRNRLAVISSVFAGLLVLLCGTASWWIPDQSPNANAQHLSIVAQKPGFSVWMIYENSNPTLGIPVEHLRVNGPRLTAQMYTEDGKGAILTYATNQVRWEHKRFLLGTDRFGRDLLSRLILGGRISLSIGLVAVLLSLLIGVLIGSTAGYWGKTMDFFLMGFTNMVWSIPTLLMVIAITLALGKGFWQIFLAVGLTMWVDVARITRGQVLSLREKEFVTAGKVLGYSHLRIIFKHILPNVTSPLIVISAANFASAILIEAGISFLGVGVQPPVASWGGMVKEHYAYLILDSPHLALIPGFAIMLTVLAFTFIGDGLRSSLDVKQS